MIRLQWEEMTEDETYFVNDLIRASVLDIVRPEEVYLFIEEDIFQIIMMSIPSKTKQRNFCHIYAIMHVS